MAENQITVELGKSITVTLGSNTVTVQASSISALRNYVDADEKLYLNGLGGDSYLLYNDTDNRVELWVNGSRKARWS